MTNCLVVGAGMRGIVAAVMLRKAGHDVILLDGGDLPGGILCSKEWDGLYLDKGCHLLDFADAKSGRLFQEILGDAIHPVERRYASINRGLKSDGIAVPDMSLFPVKERTRAVHEIRAQARETETQCNTLGEKLVRHFGETAGNYVSNCVRRISMHDPGELAPEAFETLRLVHRVRLGPDNEMEDLKSDPVLNERLAVASQTDPLRFYRHETPFTHRNYYPSRKGMHGFCEVVADYLRTVGVELRLTSRLNELLVCSSKVKAIVETGDKIEADLCYWSLPTSLFLRTIGVDDPLASYSRPVSMLLYYFRLRPEFVSDYTYIHDFTPERLCFRASAPGVYGRQTDRDGNTYVCAEIPVRAGTELWHTPEKETERIWEEMKDMDMVHRNGCFTAFRVEKLPVAFVLAGRGWGSAKSVHDSALATYKGSVLFGNSDTFGKTAIINAVESDLAELI